jgi:DNA-binding transcriptional MerR regulator
MTAADKGPGAFRTIGELSQELGVAQHILRYWETKFPQLRPLQRAGNRRYYRPADVDLARKIHRLLSKDGYTVRGVQQLLRGKSGTGSPESPAMLAPSSPPAAPEPEAAAGIDMDRLVAVRDRLAEALDS